MDSVSCEDPLFLVPRSFRLKTRIKAAAARFGSCPLRSAQRFKAFDLRRIFPLIFLTEAGAMSILPS